MSLPVIAADKGMQWARARRTAWQKIRDYFGWLDHVQLPTPTLRLGGLFRGLFRLGVWAGLATAPFWIDYFDKSDVPREHLYLYSGIMFVLLITNWALDTFVKNAAKRKRLEDHREQSAIEHRNLVNEMLSIVQVPTANLSDANFMGVVRRTLTAILQRVREELDALDAGYLEASLMVFQPNNRIQIIERAVRNRAVGASVDQRMTLAYFVARAGRDWKQVPDLKREQPFRFEGVSEPTCPYRSILLIPVLYTSTTQPEEAVAVVTIDSARPYEFWNETITDRLYKQVMPFVRLLAILLHSHPVRVRCQ